MSGVNSRHYPSRHGAILWMIGLSVEGTFNADHDDILTFMDSIGKRAKTGFVFIVGTSPWMAQTESELQSKVRRRLNQMTRVFSGFS